MQAAWLPQARRWPQNILFTHQGAVVCATSGKFVLEAEELGQVTYIYPKHRFEKPIWVGFFFFFFFFSYPEPGSADVDDAEADQPPLLQQPPQLDELPTGRLAGFDSELWFEDAPKEVDKELRYSLARLHVNMGHAPKAELVPLLQAASGNLSRRVLMALDALRCGSCIRTTNSVDRHRPP